jgi:hypothetical protein
MLIPVILAGTADKRLWPVSREVQRQPLNRELETDANQAQAESWQSKRNVVFIGAGRACNSRAGLWRETLCPMALNGHLPAPYHLKPAIESNEKSLFTCNNTLRTIPTN